jgi:hypothetical protein
METENTTPGEGSFSESDDFGREWAERRREVNRFFYQLELAVARVEGYARGYAGAFGKAFFPQAFNEAFNHTLDEDFDLVFKQAYNTSQITVDPATEADRDAQVLRLMTALACRTLNLELDGSRTRELAQKSKPELEALLWTLANERRWPEPGHADGEAAGRSEGTDVGLLISLTLVCRTFGIELDDQKRQALRAMSTTELETLLRTLVCEQRWPV